MLILEIDPNTSHLFRTEHLLMRIFVSPFIPLLAHYNDQRCFLDFETLTDVAWSLSWR